MLRTDDSARSTNLVATLCLAVADRVRAATERAAGHAGSGPAALAALTTHLEGEGVGALVKLLGVTQSAAVRVVDRLEGDGLVERRSGVDGRSVSLMMTSEGRGLGRDVLDARRRAVEEILESLNPSERHRLVSVCEKLLDGLTRSRADALRLCRLCDLDACGHDVGRCPVTEAAVQAEGGETQRESG